MEMETLIQLKDFWNLYNNPVVEKQKKEERRRRKEKRKAIAKIDEEDEKFGTV